METTPIVAQTQDGFRAKLRYQGELFSATDFPLEAVPEPASMISVGLGLLALGAIGRRRLVN